MARILSVWCRNWPITTWSRKNSNCSASDKSSPHGGGDRVAIGGGSDRKVDPAAGRRPNPPPTVGFADTSPRGGGPIALIATEGGTRRLAAVDEAAAACGLYIGQKAADAAALVPDLLTDDHDPDGDRAALEVLCDWCVRFSPAVAIDGLDGLFLDIEGVAHLWGGEAAMLDDLLARLARWGAPARGAIADTPGAAWALARFAPDCTIAPIGAPPGGQAPLLASLPVAALRLDDAAQAQLPRLGLFHVGQLLALPRGQLTRRFGAGTLMRIDQALGSAREALAFRRPVTPWFDRLAFAEPISVPDDLARAAGDITALLCARLEAEGQGARRFELVFHRLDGRDYPVRVGLSRPGRDAARITRLLKPKLETIDPGFGVEVVTLWAADVEPLSIAQRSLDADGGVGLEEGLAPLIDRLINRLGEDRVWRADPYQSHVPERAVARAAPLAPPSENSWDPTRPRPMRLFRRPEAITVMAKLPDEPPAHFTWRGQRHRVRHAEGPERIGQEWWRKAFDGIGPGKVRDYYRVEDEAGERFWIYRQGLYGLGDEPKWWMHGLFG